MRGEVEGSSMLPETGRLEDQYKEGKRCGELVPQSDNSYHLQTAFNGVYWRKLFFVICWTPTMIEFLLLGLDLQRLT